MSRAVHPRDALFPGENSIPIISSCEHYAGSEKLIAKAMELQEKLGPIFDITCDCEDGAQAGMEIEHVEMVVRALKSSANRYKQAGVRIHDYFQSHWKKEVETLICGAGEVLSYITIPKATATKQVADMINHIQKVALGKGIKREIPIHVLIETHGALRDAYEIAGLPWVKVLDFGQMDFVSGHHGAIPASAMRSPNQFEHRLLARAKTEVVAAALANGVIPSHNVTLDLKNSYTTYQDAWRARYEFGFLRMWSIYPLQIQQIVDAMKPSYEDVEDGANILVAAQKNNWGPIQYKAELHDRATFRYYWDVLQKAHISGVRIPDEAKMAFF